MASLVPRPILTAADGFAVAMYHYVKSHRGDATNPVIRLFYSQKPICLNE